MNKSYDQSFILLKLKKLQDLQMEFKMDLEKKNHQTMKKQMQSSLLNHQGCRNSSAEFDGFTLGHSASLEVTPQWLSW